MTLADRLQGEVHDAVFNGLQEQYGMALARQTTADATLARLDKLAGQGAMDTIYARQADRELRTILEQERADAVRYQEKLRLLMQERQQ